MLGTSISELAQKLNYLIFFQQGFDDHFLHVARAPVSLTLLCLVSRHRGREERTEGARLPQTTRLLQGELWH